MPRARKEGQIRRVVVRCCACAGPTGLRVPATLLEEIEVVELCKTCAGKLPDEEQPPDDDELPDPV